MIFECCYQYAIPIDGGSIESMISTDSDLLEKTRWIFMCRRYREQFEHRSLKV